MNPVTLPYEKKQAIADHDSMVRVIAHVSMFSDDYWELFRELLQDTVRDSFDEERIAAEKILGALDEYYKEVNR